LQNSGLGLPTTLGLSTTQQQIIELSEQIIDLAVVGNPSLESIVE
jgi:hypothetical protein